MGFDNCGRFDVYDRRGGCDFAATPVPFMRSPMKTLDDVMDKALRAFLSTARFDVVSAMGVLLEPDDEKQKR